MENNVRLSKLMSERNISSRREADTLIKQGLVRVNGEIVSVLGTKVPPDAQIELLESAARKQKEKVTILLNKPIGYVSTQPEKGYTEALELIHQKTQFESSPPLLPKHLKRLAAAGRLDIDSSGLLVLTQDGRVAKQLIGENSPIEKEYLVRIEGRISEPMLQQLRYGLSLDGKQLKQAGIRPLADNLIQFILQEGKKRQIRRMCELVDLKVVGLKRVRIGNITLSNLPLGKWRFLKGNEHF